MKWINLKSNKCPSCGKAFGILSVQTPGLVICGNSLPVCDFKISEKRHTEIVSSQVNEEISQRLDKEYENEIAA